ncbi:MAG: type IX secretion system outer membrane channel protein PorV [Bacteroidales bacterium]
MMKFYKILFTAITCIAFSTAAYADDTKDQFNPITTGVASLSITPDSRGASMGDLGVATDPDINSQYWNPSKYAFAYSDGGISMTYTPWLRKLVNDIALTYLAGYYKIGNEDNQAISASLRYFSLGEINTTDNEGVAISSVNPYETAFDLGYSRKLSENYSMGVVLRYVYSDLAYDSYSGESSGAGAFAADISGYYTSFPIVGRNECQWSWGWNVSNIGTKLSYNNGTDMAFLPTNLRIGTTFTFPLADYHNLSLSVDLNKLLVPTKPSSSDYETTEEYDIALEEWNDMSPITGIFKSFSDAPGGLTEELREIYASIGAEYNYNQQFFLRGGYYYENEYKGDRKYFGFGAGFSLNVVQLDAAYMISVAQSSPLDQTIRFTLSFNVDGLRELLGKVNY